MGRMKVQDVKRPDVAGLMKKLAYKPAEANNLRRAAQDVQPGRSVGLPPGRHEPVPPRPDVPARQGNPAHQWTRSWR
jgi:hypothetical protein